MSFWFQLKTAIKIVFTLPTSSPGPSGYFSKWRSPAILKNTQKALGTMLFCCNIRCPKCFPLYKVQTSQPWSTENLELEAQKSGDFSKNLEIDYYLYFWGLGEKSGTFSVLNMIENPNSFDFFEIRHFDLHQNVTYVGVIQNVRDW